MTREGRIDYQQSLNPQDAYLSNLAKNQIFDLDNETYQTNTFKPSNSVDTYLSIEANTNQNTGTNSKTNKKEPPNNQKVDNKKPKGKNKKSDTHSQKDSTPDYVPEEDQNKKIKPITESKEEKENLNTSRYLPFIEAHNKQYTIDMKSKNNQSSFAKNPTQSYSDQYYASFPTAYKLPRGGVVPLVDPYTGAPIAPYMYPFVPPMFPTYGYPNPYNPYMKNSLYFAKKGSPREPNYFNSVYPYNYWQRPNVYDDKDPSIHDLLYLDKFKTQEGSYTNKHIEKKIREVDGFYNPYGEYTVKDYKNLKANFGSTNHNEEKNEKMERMQKAKEVGNNFMKKKPKKSNTNPEVDQRSNRSTEKLVQSDTELPRINNKTNRNQNNARSNPYLNQSKNYESFDFISSNEGYGYQSENESNSQSQPGKYFKNPRFDFSKAHPVDQNENPRARALKYAKERNL